MISLGQSKSQWGPCPGSPAYDGATEVTICHLDWQQERKEASLKIFLDNLSCYISGYFLCSSFLSLSLINDPRQWSSVLSEKINRPDIFSKTEEWPQCNIAIRVWVLTRTRQVECDFNCSAYLRLSECVPHFRGRGETAGDNSQASTEMGKLTFSLQLWDFDFCQIKSFFPVWLYSVIKLLRIVQNISCDSTFK